MSVNSQSPVFKFLFLRRVPALIWILLLIITGGVSYRAMVKEALPDLEIPTFNITTVWEGATAAMVEKSITQRIEKKLKSLKGLKKITSSSGFSISSIMVQFRAEASVMESMQLLQRQLIAVQGDLPRDSERPKLEATSISDIPVTTITLSGNGEKAGLEQLAERLKKKLVRVKGIRKVSPLGIRKKVVRVQLIPQRLKALGISPLAVRNQIRENGLDAPWGKFEGKDTGFTMKMTGAYDDIRRLEQLFISKTAEGSIIRLRDIARVSMNYLREQDRAALSWEGSEFTNVVALSLLKVPGRDTVRLIGKVKEVLKKEEENAYWPKGVQWHLVGNEAEIIESELGRGLTNGWQSMLAVFLVLLILLTWREAIVAAISIPLTLCGTLGVLWACGYTLNLLMLIGMVIALGLLVDDFILIMEGMHDALVIKKQSFASAVRHTISTYALPSFSGSITTILVLTPLAFISGVDGKFLRVIPVTTAACLVISYIVSILIGPVLLRFFSVRTGHKGPSRVDRLSAYCEEKLAGWLGRKVVSGKKRALMWTLGTLMIFIVSLLASETMRTTLYPKEDGRTLGITVELAEGTSLDASEAVALRIGDILRKEGDIEHVLRIVGGQDPYSDTIVPTGQEVTPHLLGFGCFLVPGKERDRLGYEVAVDLKAALEKAVENSPGARVFVKAESGGPSSDDPLQISLSGPDINALRKVADEVQQLIRTIPGIYDVKDNIGPGRSEIHYIPMQEALDHHGLSQSELAGQMVAYMLNEKIAKFHQPGTGEDLDIRLGAWWPSQDGDMAGPKSRSELAKLSIVNGDGKVIPLQNLVRQQRVSVTPTILRTDGSRAITVSAKLKGIYIPEVIETLRPLLNEKKAQWPQDISYSFLGEKEADQTYSDMFTAFIIAIVLVYAILALLFDSLLYPGIILSTVLFALVGVFFGFMLFAIPFSFSAAIGIVALVGIVVNDAIIVVETILNHHRAGAGIFEAARNGASDRLRPIVSTTVTNFAGLLPLAMSDPGWAPICQAIIFGEITATIGAVILIPALFVLFTREKKGRASAAPASGPALLGAGH